jgi:hypothetical protein
MNINMMPCFELRHVRVFGCLCNHLYNERSV